MVEKLIPHFVATAMAVVLKFLPIFDSVRSVVDSIGLSIAAIVAPVGAIVGAIVASVSAVVSAVVGAIRTISRIDTGTLPRLGIV
jgi:hypothetical protein